MMQAANSSRLSPFNRYISSARSRNRHAAVPSIALVLLAGLAFAGCKAKTTDQDQAKPASGTEAAAGAATPGDGSQVGMIASGSAEPVATVADATEAPPAVSGGRGVTPEEAKSKVPFGLLEPVDLPPTAHRDIVRLLEADSNGTSAPATAGLPSVRFVYTIGDGSLVLLQSPATGAPGQGDAITIGSQSGWQTSADPPVLVWEQDGVRLEIRGNGLTPEVVMAAAASMKPLGAWPGPLEAPTSKEMTAAAATPMSAGTPSPTGQTG